MNPGAGGGQTVPPPPQDGQGALSPARGTSGPPDPMTQVGGRPNPALPPQFAPQQQGGAQIAVQPAAGPGAYGAGRAQPPTGTDSTIVNPPQDYSGIANALERLAPQMTDADTACNLRWQREVEGEKNKQWRNYFVS